MALFSSQKDHKVKRSHSTERVKSHLNGCTSLFQSSAPSVPPICTGPSSRQTTTYDPHPTEVHVQGLDPAPPTPKFNATPFPRHSLRRVPVPSLSVQDLDKLPHDR